MAFMLFKPVGRALLAVLLVVVVAVAWFALQIDPIFAHKSKEVIITVHGGDSFATVASELHAKGVIASPFALRLESLVLGSVDVRAGSYQLRQGSSFSTVRAILSHAPNVDVIDATPGLTLHEIALEVAGERGVDFANTFAKEATSAATPSSFSDGSSLEGLVGAGTYLITSSTTPGELAKRMVARFRREATAVGLTPTSTIDGLHAYQVITAASIVEKEGYYPRNMPKVARVILNRLARGGPLQMDSTVLYYFQQDGGTVTHAMLETPTPYNTYLNVGLTPTPICTVSKDALEAVLHAPKGSWLYFTVIDKHGDEAFATTFAQQLKNEKLAEKRGLE
jgi:UPF0755 protein